MAEDRNFLEKFIFPTKEEQKAFKEKQKKAKVITESLEEEGLFKTLQRQKEEDALNQGVPASEVRKMASDFDKEAIMPKIEKFIKDPIDTTVDTVKEVFRREPKAKEVKRDLGLPPESENEISTADSIGSAINSGLIQIPVGVVNFGTLMYDAMQEEGIPVEKSATFKFNNAFEQSYIGMIQQQSSEDARETAVGRITEALVSLYGAGKIAGKTTVPVVAWASKKARQLAPKLVQAIKGGKYLSTTKNTKNLVEGIKKTDQLNKLSKLDKFIGITVGGGAGVGMFVADEESIGTFGDIELLSFLGTGLDRDKRRSGADDAGRQLQNKLLFGAEYGFPIIPAVIGLGSVGKLIATKGQFNAFNKSKMVRWIDRWISQPFRSRSFKAQSIFDNTRKLEGDKAAIKLTSDDFIKNIDESLKQISKNTQGVATATDAATASQMIATFMLKTKDTVKNGRIFFNGFNEKILKDFKTSMKKLGIGDDLTNKVIGDSAKFRVFVANLKDAVLKGGNINRGADDFNTLITDRVNNFLGVDYKIVDFNRGKLIDGFKPTAEVKDEVAKVIQRYNTSGGKSMNLGDARLVVENILKNFEINPITKTPSFPLGRNNILDDSGVFMKNIGENITNGKFKPDGKGGLIQNLNDLAAFRKLFGEYKDARNVIANVMSDLGGVLARDKFYNRLIKESDEAIKTSGDNVGIGIVRNTYDEARLAFPNKKIIETKKGLELKAGLADDVYTSPLDGKFTTTEWAEAIARGDEILSGGIVQNALYKYLVMLPKGIVQIGKTVLGPLTAARNIFSNVVTILHNGNALYLAANPKKVLEYTRRSMAAIQPQFLYKMTGNPAYRNTEAGQQLYKYLLEEGVVNQNAVYREIMATMEGIKKIRPDETISNNVNSILNFLSTPFKKAYGVAQDFYVGGDDGFRIFNFLVEAAKLDDAFTVAVRNKVIDPKTGKVVVKPTELEIWNEAAQIVRETIPNYSYVSDVVQNVRKSPLGNFASFPSEIYRTGGNNIKRGIYESNDPVRAVIGKTRLTGAAMTYAAVPVAAYETVRGLYGITREVASAIREFVPGWSKENTLLPIYEDGEYKYIDFSNSFFYDTMIAPVSATLANVDAMKEEPLTKALAIGFYKAGKSMLEPFISESIYVEGMLDIFTRKGEKVEGGSIWNERDSFGNKFADATNYILEKYSPGNYPALKRILKAFTGEKVRGKTYKLPDELLGFFGTRKATLNIPETMNFYIGDFQSAARNENKLIYKGTLYGDRVNDTNQVIQQYIFANQQRLETFNKMRRQYDAAMVLGMTDREIRKLFDRRGELPLYKAVKNNKFKPFDISDSYIDAYKRNSIRDDVPNPLDRGTLNTIKSIQRILKNQQLNQDFLIDSADWLREPKKTSNLGLGGTLPNTPMPDQQVIQTAMMPASGVMNQGLTATENALLSEEEKQIRLRQRGLA
jgi:hypothetical protein